VRGGVGGAVSLALAGVGVGGGAGVARGGAATTVYVRFTRSSLVVCPGV
jgi:hypothetical protein